MKFTTIYCTLTFLQQLQNTHVAKQHLSLTIVVAASFSLSSSSFSSFSLQTISLCCFYCSFTIYCMRGRKKNKQQQQKKQNVDNLHSQQHKHQYSVGRQAGRQAGKRIFYCGRSSNSNYNKSSIKTNNKQASKL